MSYEVLKVATKFKKKLQSIPAFSHPRTVDRGNETLKLTKYNLTLILDTASSACIIRVVFVGCPSHTSCVDPKYLARNKTPSIKTAGSKRPGQRGSG